MQIYRIFMKQTRKKELFLCYTTQKSCFIAYNTMFGTNLAQYCT